MVQMLWGSGIPVCSRYSVRSLSTCVGTPEPACMLHVHLWEYCGMWELFPIESHEIFYVTTCNAGLGTTSDTLLDL